jgi:hypothetical protein
MLSYINVISGGRKLIWLVEVCNGGCEYFDDRALIHYVHIYSVHFHSDMYKYL